ncbi:MAG: carbonic anhydrase [Dokdonella sp.]|uniref:carbonic anhydrase n=1 Tax=Dokdonella sp. TaxID=2291710 RepID=UPI0025C40B82|nr:carbonic anhydrase [Dokdonella sp.]MBZ0221816.1 carbonic anhydrase [Dokdonella sp.]MCC7254319.1 carbonic anhydrase [Dokdonella sp.]
MSDSAADSGLSRRHLLGLGLGALASTLLPRGALAQLAPTHSADTPAQSLALLKAGNARYVANKPRHRDFSAGRASRNLGQAPHAAILSCADSRVAPELLFDQAPGELFVVRVAGNFVTDAGLGSLEYGAQVLGTRLILVLGHKHCGAVTATLKSLRDGKPLPGHIEGLVEAMKPGIAPVLEHSGEDDNERAIVANVRHNMQRLQQSQPILAQRVKDGTLAIAGGVYDLASGRVEFL